LETHPERWRDRPVETSATTNRKIAGAKSGSARLRDDLEDEVKLPDGFKSLSNAER